jgi:hypothetical protein
VAGYEKLINPQFAASVNYVYRKVKKAIDWYDPEDDGEGIITNVPKTGKNWSEYQAIEAALRKRFGPDGFQFIAAYTYVFDQKNWAANWWNALPGAFIGPYSELSRWYGRAEAKHEVKFNGSYTFPFKTIVGLSLYWNSGNVYTPYGTITRRLQLPADQARRQDRGRQLGRGSPPGAAVHDQGREAGRLH